jgi:hypothetical protein
LAPLLEGGKAPVVRVRLPLIQRRIHPVGLRRRRRRQTRRIVYGTFLHAFSHDVLS